MARLPKIKLRHRRTGARVNVGLLAYARDLARWSAWQRIGETRGDADDSEMAREARELEGERARALRPERSAAPALQAQRRLTLRAAADPDRRGDRDWRRMPWFQAAAHVRRVTGIWPRNKRHAAKLMAARRRGDAE